MFDGGRLLGHCFHPVVVRIDASMSDAASPAASSLAPPKSNPKGALRRESLRKNVAAIHVSGKLTLLQRKLSNVLLLNAYDELLSRRTHAVDARTLCVMIGYNSNDMDTLKEALRALVETTAEWDLLGDDGAREWGVSALLASARLRAGVCEYAYSPALAEKLHDPKIFSLINLSVQRNFSSGHALALYENCYRFIRTGSTGWWELGLFRKLMGVEDSEYYKIFKHLNAKVIKPAVAEVNAVSNIRIDVDLERRGREVARIRFRIAEKPLPADAAFSQLPPAVGDAGSEGMADLHARLRELGVADRLARQWISEHGEAYVAEKLDYVAARSRDGKVRGSPVGYLSAAIRDDYRSQARTAGAARSVAATRSGQVDEAVAVREAARARLAALRRSHRAASFDAVEALVAARSPAERDADRRKLLSLLSDEADRDDFRARGWRSALNARAIFAFWNELYPGALPTFEDVAAAQSVVWSELCAAAGEPEPPLR